MPYPDRIDFAILPDQRIVVTKLRDRGGRSIPTAHEIKAAGFDLDAALTWCHTNGYTVATWPGGARAWYGDRWRVIRTGLQIVQMRSRLEKELEGLRRQGSQNARRREVAALLRYDLAYCG